MQNIKNWFRSGDPYIWLNAGAVSICLLLVVGLMLLIGVRGFAHFWPASIIEFDYTESDGEVIRLLGEKTDSETIPRKQVVGMDNLISPELKNVDRFLLKTGNRDYFGIDFRWVLNPLAGVFSYPVEAIAVERREWGNLYGYLKAVKQNEQIISGSNAWAVLQEKLKDSNAVFAEIRKIEKHQIGEVNYKIEKLRLKERGYELDGITDERLYTELEESRTVLNEEYNKYTEQLAGLYTRLNQYQMVATLSDGREVTVPLSKMVRAYRPNAMNVFQKTGFYFEKLWEFVSDEPREANTEGGIFPAIFGTVVMVMVMAVLVTPFGVIAAVYLREYARQGPTTRAIRIAVNNLAGVPSVVYGVFGLGFFVYFLGGSIDQLFFREALPSPTFGTPGLMWASLTLAILTVPVVIVATEEGLTRVPRTIREGSLALGATKAETLWRTVLPMTASAMMTGLILAVARAAGEVAPLMLVGVVKLAPSLPLDGNAPFLHLDRKFMHLGFHIYDVGFQSPNVDAARPLVYATALLLVLIIIILNLTAIRIRNRLREKYSAAEQH
jgi:phosphate transport system permease protein